VSAPLPPALRIQRAAERVARPWKNGGGITRELAAHPPGSGLTQFDWRVSIAEIRAAGTFSSFPGIERRLAVLSGRLSLSIDAGAPCTLAPDSAPLAFAGEAAVFAEPLAGPAQDLNVMTRRGRFASGMRRCVVRGAMPLAPQPGTRLILALGNLAVRGVAGSDALARLDALWLGEGEQCELRAGSAGTALYVIEIAATA
jgi:environmental stress-induced protein Ves